MLDIVTYGKRVKINTYVHAYVKIHTYIHACIPVTPVDVDRAFILCFKF